MCRHLELLPLWFPLWCSPLFFLLTPSANRPVAVEATKELWSSSGVLQRPHCSLGPSSCCQMGEGFSFWLLSEDQPSGAKGGFLSLPYLSCYICLFLVGAWAFQRGLLTSSLPEKRSGEDFQHGWIDVSVLGEDTQFFWKRREKTKLSLVYKCNLYRTRRVVPKIFSPPPKPSLFILWSS